MDATDRDKEIARLEAMLASSQGMDGYRDRVKAIEARLEELRNAE